MKKVVITVLVIVVVVAAIWGGMELYKKYNPKLDAKGFPVNPKSGDLFTKGGVEYKYVINEWVLVSTLRSAGGRMASNGEFNTMQLGEIDILASKYLNTTNEVLRKDINSYTGRVFGYYIHESNPNAKAHCEKGEGFLCCSGEKDGKEYFCCATRCRRCKCKTGG